MTKRYFSPEEGPSLKIEIEDSQVDIVVAPNGSDWRAATLSREEARSIAFFILVETGGLYNCEHCGGEAYAEEIKCFECGEWS